MFDEEKWMTLWNGNWTLSGDIVEHLENEKYQGEFHIYNGKMPIGNIKEKDIRKIKGTKHIASNFGNTELHPGTTHILSPDGKEGYVLLQEPYEVQKYIVKIEGDYAKMAAGINPNPLKLYDGGDFYLIEGSFSDVLDEIVAANYKVIEKKDKEDFTTYASRLFNKFNMRVI
ncbi:MAG: hypothetical protein ABIG84_02965 [archaeon]